MTAPLSRRAFVKGLLAAPTLLSCFQRGGSWPRRFDVLFIVVDDVNDWIAPLGGYAGPVHTPNLERLARRGTLFSNAHCPAPSCKPSRASTLTGLWPESVGIHGSEAGQLRDWLPDAVTLPQYFKADGYATLGFGKIFHTPDPVSWDEELFYWRDPQPGKNLSGIEPTLYFDWGPIDLPESFMGDRQMVEAALARLVEPRDRPLFLAAGIRKPHLPWYVPREYYDLYSPEQIVLPEVLPEDLEDVPPSWRRGVPITGDHARVERAGLWKSAIRGYLASMSFADKLVGLLIDAVDSGPRAADTVIVLWSDHGWHLGEKLHWRKFSLWEEATHVPLMISVPGLTSAGSICRRAVSLVDIFPTLVELCGLAPLARLEGESLVPLLEDPASPRQRPALTTWHKGNRAVRSDRWRYIRYADGSEELYDHAEDPNEWKNLAADPAYDGVKADLARWIGS